MLDGRAVNKRYSLCQYLFINTFISHSIFVTSISQCNMIGFTPVQLLITLVMIPWHNFIPLQTFIIITSVYSKRCFLPLTVSQPLESRVLLCLRQLFRYVRILLRVRSANSGNCRAHASMMAWIFSLGCLLMGTMRSRFSSTNRRTNICKIFRQLITGSERQTN